MKNRKGFEKKCVERSLSCDLKQMEILGIGIWYYNCTE